MEGLQASNVGDFGTEMQRLQLDMQMGQTPDPERLNKVADGIDQVSVSIALHGIVLSLASILLSRVFFLYAEI